MSIQDALPGWTGYINGIPQSGVCYNDRALDTPSISLYDRNSQEWQPLTGNYSVYLSPSPLLPFLGPVAIGQTGRIPDFANSLIFYTNPYGNLAVTFAGQPLQEVELGVYPTYRAVGVDISSFAGQVGELQFIAGPNIGSGELDGIYFSGQVVPEPGVLALLSLGGIVSVAAFGRRRPRGGVDPTN